MKLEKHGNITDITVTQPESFASQMLRYAEEFTTLPDEN